MGSLLRALWGFLDHFGRALVLWQLGGAAVITALAGWAVAAAVEMPTVFLVLLLAGLFVLSFASIGLIAPHALAHLPAPQSREPPIGDKSSSLQKIRLIRNEIDEGATIVQRAIGVEQVYELVEDQYWIGHRNELARISEAGAAHRLAGKAWEGFRRYNNAVKARTFISNDDLEGIAADARRAVDALGVAADALR